MIHKYFCLGAFTSRDRATDLLLIISTSSVLSMCFSNQLKLTNGLWLNLHLTHSHKKTLDL